MRLRTMIVPSVLKVQVQLGSILRTGQHLQYQCMRCLSSRANIHTRERIFQSAGPRLQQLSGDISPNIPRVKHIKNQTSASGKL